MILLTRVYLMKWLKKLMLFTQTKENLEKKIKDVDQKTPDTSKFAVTQEFNKLIKINFNAQMAEASKKLAIKTQVEKALDLGDKNRKKN